METGDRAPRLLGAVFLGVIVTSLASGMLLMTAAGSGGISDVLRHIAENDALAHLSVVAAMVNCLGILILAALLYVVLEGQSRLVAIVGLGCWVGEALLYAIAWIGVAGLVPLSHDFVAAGAPEPSGYQALGAFLYDGINGFGQTIHMFLYCAGGLAWYALLYRSRLVPRAIPGYGLAAVVVGLVGSVVGLLGNDVPMLAYLPILPFELVVGAWLLFRGVAAGSTRSATPTATAWRPAPAARP